MSDRHDNRTSPAGPRFHFLSVVSLGMLALLVGLIVALFASSLSYESLSLRHVVYLAGSPEILAAMQLSLTSSLLTLAAVMIFAVPAGYALARYRFPGRALADAIVDMPLVVPPVIIGLSLVMFLSTGTGQTIESGLKAGGWSLQSTFGIVLCQFFLCVPYAVRSAKTAFLEVDRSLEQTALTLGCTRWQAFRKVTLPLARNGLVAGGVVAWARALGVFGPMLVLLASAQVKVETMSTHIYLELSSGNLEFAIAATAIMMVLAGAALLAVHALAPGRKWS